MITPTRSELSRFLRTETVGGSLLLIAAAAALLWVNSPWGAAYTTMTETVVAIEPLHLELTLADWVKDGLLAVFFFVVGLELKRELVVGELADPKRAALPIIAAFGGVVLPAVIAYTVGFGVPGMDRGWAIPVATDIAFALAVLALTGSRIPAGARVFLLSLAVVDDLLAIILIAVLFTTGLALLWLLAAAGCFAAWWLAQRQRIRTPLVYVPLALVSWYALHEAGIHPTLAGVAAGLLTRVRPDPGESQAPATRWEHLFQPISAGLCVPLFAFFASGVPLNSEVFGELFTERLSLAVILGLLIGKIVGIFGISWLAIRFGIAKRPTRLGYRDMFALSVLGAIGFTVSLLVAELALTDNAAVELAKAAVLVTSLTASVAGSALLLRRGRVHQARRDAAALERQEAEQCRDRERVDQVSVTQGGNGNDARGSTVAAIPLSEVDPHASASFGSLVRDATEQVSTLVRAEVELAKAEVTGEIKKGLQGSVFFIVALTILLFSSFFFFFAVAETLAIWLPRWSAFWIVFALMVLATAAFAFLGYRKVKKLRAPEKTIDSLKQTRTVLPSGFGTHEQSDQLEKATAARG